jgi:hypothetical protein
MEADEAPTRIGLHFPMMIPLHQTLVPRFPESIA